MSDFKSETSWNDIPEASAQNYAPLPDGRYIAKFADCENKYKTNGVESWQLKLEIVCGPESKPDPAFVGRTVLDWLTWGNPDDESKNKTALSRCKLIFKRAGYDTDKMQPKDCLPDMLIGREVIITLQQKTLPAQDGKLERVVSNVTFAGYEEATPAEAAPF